MQIAVSWSLTYQTVYNHFRNAVVNFLVVGLSDGLQSSRGCVSPALSMQMAVSRSLAYRTVYNHFKDAFLLHWVCSCQSSGRWPIRRSTIIQKMRFSCTEYANGSFVVVGLLDGLGMRFFCTKYAVVNFLVVGISDGLQSSKGCVSPALSIQLLVSWSLAYLTVYNHRRDAFLLHWVLEAEPRSRQVVSCIKIKPGKGMIVGRAVSWGIDLVARMLFVWVSFVHWGSALIGSSPPVSRPSSSCNHLLTFLLLRLGSVTDHRAHTPLLPFFSMQMAVSWLLAYRTVYL